MLKSRPPMTATGRGPRRSWMKPAMTYHTAMRARPMVVTHEVCARVQPNSFSSGSMNTLMP